MSNLLKLYKNLREKDKKQISTIPLENRIILSKLITNTNADVELKYVWINRAVAQASNKNTTAILGLLKSDNNEYKISRRMTLKLRKKQNNPVPYEISNIDDFNNFIKKYDKNYIIIKQNYPNYKNEEYLELKKYDFKNIKIINANSEEGNIIIGSNEALEKLYTKSTKWFNNNIEKYLLYFYKKNKLNISDKEFKLSIKTMQKLIKALIIPTEFYKGKICGLREKINELLKKDFLPVLKFSNSISGYGVHYPKNIRGEYDKQELQNAIKTDNSFIDYLINALNKNGQNLDAKFITSTIRNDGIILQKFIKGKDYAIGFLKPLKIYNKNFSLGIIDMDISDVLTNGTAHYADVIHYQENYINLILKNTIFSKQQELVFFSIEILIYLLYLNEGFITKPEEFENVNFEDFGVQLMVDDLTGEIGLIEINGRTPSHNFNNFNLLSIYGENYIENIETPNVLCTSAKIFDIKDFCGIISDEIVENKFIDFLLNQTKNKYANNCQLLSFQVMDNNICLYYTYFLQDTDSALIKIQEICSFFKQCMKEFLLSNV